MQEALYDLLAETRRRGRTVFMSSHVLPEVERVCDRIALLRRGELVIVSTVDAVRRLAARRVRIVFAQATAAPARWPDGTEPIEIAPAMWSLRVSGPLGPVVALTAGANVADLDVDEPHLEEVLKRYYRDEQA
jgi:ABC-2 type transport system ATP-binding protein